MVHNHKKIKKSLAAMNDKAYKELLKKPLAEKRNQVGTILASITDKRLTTMQTNARKKLYKEAKGRAHHFTFIYLCTD